MHSHWLPGNDPGFAKGQSQKGISRMSNCFKSTSDTGEIITIHDVSLVSLHHLQGDKNNALNHLGSYSQVHLSPQAKEKVMWWRDNLEAWNGKSPMLGSPDLAIGTKCILQGLGIFCTRVATGEVSGPKGNSGYTLIDSSSQQEPLH